jgi:hypothetical protein
MTFADITKNRFISNDQNFNIVNQDEQKFNKNLYENLL